MKSIEQFLIIVLFFHFQSTEQCQMATLGSLNIHARKFKKYIQASKQTRWQFFEKLTTTNTRVNKFELQFQKNIIICFQAKTSNTYLGKIKKGLPNHQKSTKFVTTTLIACFKLYDKILLRCNLLFTTVSNPNELELKTNSNFLTVNMFLTQACCKSNQNMKLT